MFASVRSVDFVKSSMNKDNAYCFMMDNCGIVLGIYFY